MKSFWLLSCVSVATLVAGTAAATTQQPDAGQTLQELRPAPPLPPPSPTLPIQPPATAPAQPGGPKVEIQSILIKGNSLVTTEKLLALLQDAPGQSFDLAGLKGLADRISSYYHANDYPFARALIPAQTMKDGALEIDIIEGRYGKVTVTGDPRAQEAQGFLNSLEPGAVIEGKPLERAVLILGDQPGYKVVPIIRPGQETGTGDLGLRLEREKRFGGSVGGDNYGNRYTGQWRGQLDLYANSPLMLGDRFDISGIYTEENMWFGSARYDLPIGTSGLRANIGYAHTHYELGGSFSSLDAHGTAKIASAGLSYPIVRSQKTNLSISAGYQHKWLNDDEDATETNDSKSSDDVSLAVNFDSRDGFLGGGIIYGSLGWTHGILNLDHGLEEGDRSTAKSQGQFDKFNLDVVRLQALPVDNLTLFTRVSAQIAADNLDSSEDFGLGGPYGVRAYPTGESYGDEGLLAQLELRYAIGPVTPYGFFDYGYSIINQDPWTSGDNHRSLGGGGLGVRVAYHGWNADALVAWRSFGGKPQSDTKDRVPLFWVSLSYDF